MPPLWWGLGGWGWGTARNLVAGGGLRQADATAGTTWT